MKQLLTLICFFALQITAQDKTKTPQWLGILTLAINTKTQNWTKTDEIKASIFSA
jgi:hypothetical protein